MRIDIVAFDGMDELDAVGPLEVLRRGGFDVQLVGFEDRVRCANGLSITTDGRPRSDADLIVFPGGGWNNRAPQGARAEADSKRWTQTMEAAARRGAILASVCTGAMILASAGMLKGRRATTHHGTWADLEAAGAMLIKERVVDDGDRITAGGVTSGIDLALHVVERYRSAELAHAIAEELEYRPAATAC